MGASPLVGAHENADAFGCRFDKTGFRMTRLASLRTLTFEPSEPAGVLSSTLKVTNAARAGFRIGVVRIFCI